MLAINEISFSTLKEKESTTYLICDYWKFKEEENPKHGLPTLVGGRSSILKNSLLHVEVNFQQRRGV